jgi:hypothetical protein
MDHIDRRNYAVKVLAEVDAAAQFFDRRALIRDRIKDAADIVELLAAFVALAANIPQIQQELHLGSSGSVEIGSLIVLICVLLVDRLFSHDPPERSEDYLLYFELYSKKMESLLNSEWGAEEKGRMDLLLEFSEETLSDVCSKWHGIREFIDDKASEKLERNK